MQNVRPDRKKYILFDFDGVIADSFETAFGVQKMLCPHITRDEYRRRFEGNINDWHRPENNHTDKCRHDIDFFGEYIPRMKKTVKIMPKVADVIRDLSQNYTLIIISSTISSPIDDFLMKNGLKDVFAETMGNDINTSKVEKIKMFFKKNKTNENECVFITDTLGDMKEAKVMKVGSIGVRWGFHDEETLRKGEPFCIVDEPNDIPKAIEDYFINLSKKQ